jgi:hypothetical protein
MTESQQENYVSGLDPTELAALASAVYQNAGLSAQDARLAADTLVQADLWGHQSHGLLRLGWYYARLLSGAMKPVTNTTIEVDAGAIAVMDGHDGVGQVITKRATLEAVQRALKHGVGVVSIRNSNHFGTCMYYTRMGAEQDCIMMLMSNAGPNMAPGVSIQATFTAGAVHTPFTGSMRIVFNARAGIDRNAESSVKISSSNTSFQSDTRPLPYFLGWQLGYRTAIYQLGGGYYDSSGNTSPGIPQSAISEGICLITGPQYVFLCIDDYNNNVNNYYASAYGSSTIAPNIIARLNIKQQINSAGAYGVVSGESLSTSLTYSREYFGPVDIQRLRITLIDDFGRVLDLNNMDWSFALMFECVYSSSIA